jgi:tetratricopeptide (TPR) repeat protein
MPPPVHAIVQPLDGVANQGFTFPTTMESFTLHKQAVRERDACDLTRAMATLELALAADPDSPQVHKEMALMLTAMWRYQDSLVWYERALTFKSDYFFCLLNIPWPLIMLGQYDRAASFIERALLLCSTPLAAKAFFFKGVLQNHRGDFSGSVETLQRVNKGEFYDYLKDLQAITWLTEIISLHNIDPAAALVRGASLAADHRAAGGRMYPNLDWVRIKGELAVAGERRARSLVTEEDRERDRERAREAEEVRRRLAAELVSSSDEDARPARRKGKPAKKKKDKPERPAREAQNQDACECGSGGLKNFETSCQHWQCQACTNTSTCRQCSKPLVYALRYF